MKIRTDFVTNSSSSSFIVEVEIELNDLSLFSFKSKSSSKVNMKCSPSKIAKSAEIKDLFELLSKSYKGGSEISFDNFLKNISSKISSVDEISSITVKRIWNAFGEGASCHMVNDKELLRLAEKVVKSKKGEQEIVADELKKYIEDAEVYTEGGWSQKWPTGFCSSEVIPRYKCGKKVNSMVSLAKKLVKQPYSDDLAVETIYIDMNTKKYTESADFYMYGTPGEEKENRATNPDVIRSYINKNYPWVVIEENVSLNQELSDAPEDTVDFLLSCDQSTGTIVVIKTKENAKTKDFDKIENFCQNNNIGYICLDREKDNTVTKMAMKINLAVYWGKFKKYIQDAQYNEHEWEEIKTSGEGVAVRVMFADGRAYDYACCDSYNIGDIVFVKSSRLDCCGMIVATNYSKDISECYPVMKRLKI